MRPAWILIAALGSGAALQAAAPASWTANYDQTPWESALHADWGPRHLGRDGVVVDKKTGERVIRVKYPQGGLGPDNGGMQYLLRFGRKGHPFPGDLDHVFVRYDLFFERGFDFSKGGKLPGLCGNSDLSLNPKTGGGGPPKGDGEGFSAKVMWREGGRAAQYVYWPGQKDEYGDYFWWEKAGQPVRLQIGRWQSIESEVLLNTPGRDDGVIRSWLDGVQVLERKGLRLRKGKDLHVNVFYFSTFFGGSTPDWAPHVDSYARFGPIQISSQRE